MIYSKKMKRLGGLLIAAVLAIVCWQCASVSAAACSNVTTYGTVRLSVPSLPHTGDYSLWLRMQSPFKGAQLYIDINQESCLVITAEEIPVNEWYWQGFSDNDTIQPYRFSATSGNSITIIGIDGGVKVDKLIVTEPDCVPVDFGDNCRSGVAVQPGTSSAVIQLTPLASQPVQGDVVVSATPFNAGSNLQEVRYIVGGTVVQHSSNATPLDTTRLTNGKHTVFIETQHKDGSVMRESTILEVKNSESFFSPVHRWLKINGDSAVPLIALGGGTFALVMLLYLLRGLYIRKRNLRLRGF